MTRSLACYATLLVSGTIAAAIGAAIVVDPVGFHSTGGIHLGADPALLNEMRAAGGALLAVGLLALAGVVFSRLRMLALTTSAMVYSGYGLARFVSFLMDGMPDQTLVWIALLELVVGAACFAAAAISGGARTG